jgi:hypothetical protein
MTDDELRITDYGLRIGVNSFLLLKFGYAHAMIALIWNEYHQTKISTYP